MYRKLICKCCLLYGLQALFVKDLNIMIIFRSEIKLQENKVKSSEKLLLKLKKIGILRVEKVTYCARDDPKRWFKIKQEDIIEFLDDWSYETKS